MEGSPSLAGAAAFSNDAPNARAQIDPRLYQIAALFSLTLWGITRLDFDVSVLRIAILVSTALVTQWVFTKLFRIERFDPRSALISSLSLALLLRTDSGLLAASAAAIAVGTKFVIRWRGKHIFNPTDIALVALLLATKQAWVSPAQWGSATFFGFFLVCIGGIVVNRAARADVTFAFLAIFAALVVGRALWLGDPLAIPLHRLESGALLIFAFFMISDPKTTPDSRTGRILFAGAVAFGGFLIQTKLFNANGLLYSLAFFSLSVPLIDRLLPGDRYCWSSHGPTSTVKEKSMKRRILFASLFLIVLAAQPAMPFCGFYVAKADTKIFNKASQVAIVHNDDKTVITMANDFQGNLKEFAIVVPVPTFIKREQIHVGDKAVLDHLDAYSSPRLVEYFDENPCQPRILDMAVPAPQAAGAMRKESRANSLGVKIEAQYTVGEYDILILSAKESGGLITWLSENGYKLPAGATNILGSYIKQNMKFFVARVNLKEQSRLGFSYLRPLQVAFTSPKFMLPIRLGTLNANGPQELFIYMLSKNGRVETTNYRTIKLPTGMDVPLYVKDKFGPFYTSMFSRQTAKSGMTAVFLEYAWDMSWCDPCAAQPLSNDELKQIGVFWLGDAQQSAYSGIPVFLTRLHVRYDAAHFPEDLAFQETGDRENFQARYVLRHAWTGNDQCAAATQYRKSLRSRYETEATTLADLTGWKIDDIRKQMKLVKLPVDADQDDESWWSKIWP